MNNLIDKYKLKFNKLMPFHKKGIYYEINISNIDKVKIKLINLYINKFIFIILTPDELELIKEYYKLKNNEIYIIINEFKKIKDFIFLFYNDQGYTTYYFLNKNNINNVYIYYYFEYNYNNKLKYNKYERYIYHHLRGISDIYIKYNYLNTYILHNNTILNRNKIKIVKGNNMEDIYLKRYEYIKKIDNFKEFNNIFKEIKEYSIKIIKEIQESPNFNKYKKEKIYILKLNNFLNRKKLL
jgi:hypothetical protein